MNSISLVGKVVEEPLKSRSSSGLDMSRVKIAVNKISKDGNSNGYEIFEVLGFNNIANMTIKVGDIIGVVGKVSANNFEKEEKKYYNCQIICNSIDVLA